MLFLLVVTRMAGLVRQEERAAARELALRRAGVELVAAGGREQVNEAAISAVLALVGGPRRVRLVLLDGERRGRRRLVRRRGRMAGLERRPTRWLRESARATQQVSLASLPEEVRSQLRLHEGQAVLRSAALGS